MDRVDASHFRSRLQAVLRAAGATLMGFVYPPVCSGCGKMVGRSSALCPACWSTVCFIERPFCEITGLPFNHDRGEGWISPQAMANPPPYARARAAVYHDGVARKIVHGLKYSDRADLAAMMAAWMVRAGRDVVDDSDIIIAVPLHRGRMLARRYNQSAELARWLARLTGKPFVPGVMKRVRATRQQVGLGLKARQDNVRGAFLTDPEQAQRFLGLKVLLVDDVLTTGSTVEAATRCLLRAGAVQVNVLTFARVASQGGETLYA